MSVFEILNLRSQWEELARNLNTDIDSSISALKHLLSIAIRVTDLKKVGLKLWKLLKLLYSN